MGSLGGEAHFICEISSYTCLDVKLEGYASSTSNTFYMFLIFWSSKLNLHKDRL